MTSKENRDLNPAACKDLVINVLYHAVRDYKSSARAGAIGKKPFADEDHITFCTKYRYEDGMEEVLDFITSSWCERLCDELETLNLEDLMTIIQ